MKFLFWNIRGVGNLDSFNILKRLVVSQRPRILVIIEPKVTFDRFRFQRPLGLDSVFIHSYNKILVFSHECDKVELVRDHAQFMHFVVGNIALRPFFFSAIYGRNVHGRKDVIYRKVFGTLICNLPHGLLVVISTLF